MIDRAARDVAIAAFEEYLDDGITAFEFDDRVQSIATEDGTVNEVVHAAWFHYDDCKDHKITLSKEEWDYFQRLLLLLKSNAKFSSSPTKHWSWDHALAWLAVIAFVITAFFVGWGYQLFAVAVPFGIISLLINLYRVKSNSVPHPRDIAFTPFASFGQIRRFRRRVPGFKKRRVIVMKLVSVLFAVLWSYVGTKFRRFWHGCSFHRSCFYGRDSRPLILSNLN